jgi:hypothetical protein
VLVIGVSLGIMASIRIARGVRGERSIDPAREQYSRGQLDSGQARAQDGARF